jgi:hypothetical protein
VAGKPRCVAPVIVRGRVLDVAHGGAIAGARVLVVATDGSALAKAAITGSEGAYEISVPVDRKSGGAPIEGSVSLRVDAAGFQTFRRLRASRCGSS